MVKRLPSMKSRLWRYLSPANAPRPDGLLEFHVRAVNSGWVSRALVAHSRVGDTWRIGPPMGRLHVDPASEREVLMVGGGTGMAPIKALLQDLTTRPKPPKTQVFVGGSIWEDLYDFGALRKLSYGNTWLDIIPVVEKDESASGAERGTLADVVTRYGMGSLAWTVMVARSQPRRLCSTTRPSQDAGPRSTCAAVRIAPATTP